MWVWFPAPICSGNPTGRGNRGAFYLEFQFFIPFLSEIELRDKSKMQGALLKCAADWRNIQRCSWYRHMQLLHSFEERILRRCFGGCEEGASSLFTINDTESRRYLQDWSEILTSSERCLQSKHCVQSKSERMTRLRVWTRKPPDIFLTTVLYFLCQTLLKVWKVVQTK